MDKDEQKRMKAYFLSQARKYEKKGFSFAALELYRSFQPAKAKRMYTSIGKRAEKAGLFLLAAEAYQSAKMIKKSRILYRKAALEFQKHKLPTLAGEMFEKSRPEDPKYEKTRKFTFAATSLSRGGKFREAQEQWIKAAEYREKIKDFQSASSFYFNGGDIKNAKRAWNKAAKH